jgi:hypothetical protein
MIIILRLLNLIRITSLIVLHADMILSLLVLQILHLLLNSTRTCRISLRLILCVVLTSHSVNSEAEFRIGIL